MPIVLHFIPFLFLLLYHVIVAFFGDSVMLLWTLVHLVLGIYLVVYFLFCVGCKGNVIPRGWREKGLNIL
jgi:hypothetical protein